MIAELNLFVESFEVPATQKLLVFDSLLLEYMVFNALDFLYLSLSDAEHRSHQNPHSSHYP